MQFNEEHFGVCRDVSNQSKVDKRLRDDLIQVWLFSAEIAQTGEPSVREHNVVLIILQIVSCATESETPTFAPLAVENTCGNGERSQLEFLKL